MLAIFEMYGILAAVALVCLFLLGSLTRRLDWSFRGWAETFKASALLTLQGCAVLLAVRLVFLSVECLATFLLG
jgi:hypothetical protein